MKAFNLEAKAIYQCCHQDESGKRGSQYLARRECSTEAEKGEMVSQMTIEPCWVYTEVVHRGTWLRMPFTFQI